VWPTLSWRSHPVVDDYPRSLLLVAIVVAVCVGVWVSFGGLGYAVLAAAFLMGSLVRYFVPTHYELGDAGVAVRFLGHTRRVSWPEVRRVAVHREGVFLSPFERPSRLDSFRGTFLRFACGDKRPACRKWCKRAACTHDEVVSFVQGQRAAVR